MNLMSRCTPPFSFAEASSCVAVFFISCSRMILREAEWPLLKDFVWPMSWSVIEAKTPHTEGIRVKSMLQSLCNHYPSRVIVSKFKYRVLHALKFCFECHTLKKHEKLSTKVYMYFEAIGIQKIIYILVNGDSSTINWLLRKKSRGVQIGMACLLGLRPIWLASWASVALLLQ